MQLKNSILLIGLLLFLNTFYGCAGLQTEPVVKNYFDLNINLPVSHRNNLCNGDTLLVKEFFINPAFDSHSFIYRITKNEYVNDFYNEFISYPSKLITEKIAETLCVSSHFSPAVNNIKQNIRYRLSGKITRLYGDFQNTNEPKAIIEIRMILEKKTDDTFQTISNKTYLTQEPILSHKPVHLISGWNSGLTKIVLGFLKDLQTLGGRALF